MDDRMRRKLLIFLTSFTVLALVCCSAIISYQNRSLEQQVSHLERDLADLGKEPVPIALDFSFPVQLAAETDDYGVDRGMKADEIMLRDGASSSVGVPWDVERAMIPTIYRVTR